MILVSVVTGTSVKCEPMKPSAPVMRTVILLNVIEFIINHEEELLWYFRMLGKGDG
jgi:hypothetical protein